jgi:hypothetical protein
MRTFVCGPLFFSVYRGPTADGKIADHKLANTLIDEFPCRPHWTKNSREVLARSVKNLDPDVSLFVVAGADEG